MMTQPRWVLAAILYCAVGLNAQDREALIDQVLGDSAWELESAVTQYGSSQLEDLVGQNVDEVLQYGANGASAFEIGASSGTVEVTLFEMIDSAAAYGLFALERDWTRPGFVGNAVIGTESYRQGDALVFWQSSYVGKLAGPVGETAALAQTFTHYITGGSRKAPVSTLLPAEGLVSESEKYVLTPRFLEQSTGLDPTHLGFENSVEVALGEYRRNGSAARLALFLFPTQQLASRHVDAWMASQDEAPPSYKTGPLFAIVTASDSPELTEAILTGVHYRSEVTWNEPLPDPLTVPYMILTIFKWIGVALLTTLIVGVGFGTFRIYMKTRYPGVVFKSDDEAGLIQLNIDQSFTRKQLRH